MGLQVRTTGDADYGQHIKALVCGPAGAGKTLFSSTFPGAVFASAEGGLMSIASRKLKYADVGSPSDVKELISMLSQDEPVRDKMFGIPVKTLVVDTMDETQKLFIQERLRSKKLEALDMQGWGWLGEQMRSVLRSLRNLPLNVVFTCHLKEVTDNESGQVFFKPALQGAVGDEIANYMDLALLLRNRVRTVVDPATGNSKRVIERYLQTYPDSQHTWIKDRSGTLENEVPVNFTDDYERIHSSIFGFMGSSTPEVVVPDPDPVVSEPTETPVVVSPEPKQKSEVGAKFKCEECGEEFDDLDQRDLSKAMARRVLDKKCYEAQKEKK